MSQKMLADAGSSTAHAVMMLSYRREVSIVLEMKSTRNLYGAKSWLQVTHPTKSEELDPSMDLTKHHLACSDSLGSLVGKELAVASDRLSITANMSAYSIRVDYDAASREHLDIATCVFVQALLNGDINAMLAYRCSLDPQDQLVFSDLEIPLDYSLSSMMLPGQSEDENPRGHLFRARILPLSLKSDGMSVRGQLWIRRHLIDFSGLAERSSYGRESLYRWFTAHDDCVEGALHILGSLASDNDGPPARLAWWVYWA